MYKVTHKEQNVIKLLINVSKNFLLFNTENKTKLFVNY